MRWFLVGCALVAGACTREPAAEVCPAAGTGDLVITELRPEQGGTYAEWIELYNASGSTLDLQGTIIEVLAIDADTPVRLLIRAPLEVPDGGYVALGDATEDKPYLAYRFGADFEETAVPSRGRITVIACGELIDQLDLDGLPDEGTYSLGVVPPDADANDVDGAWCADTTPSTDTTELGLPGTPGEANIACVTPAI